MESEQASGTFRVAFVPGVTLGKWTRIWGERLPGVPLEAALAVDGVVAALLDGRADVGFARLPIDQGGLSVIPLYREIAVVLAPKEHPIAAFESITLADLAGEELRRDPDDVGGAAELVAAGVGLLLLPQSVARLHSRKDLIARRVTDAEETQIVLVWLTERTTDLVEEFVGIVRGRTARSSRSSSGVEETVAAPQRAKPAQAAPRRKDADRAARERVARGRSRPSASNRKRRGR